MRVGARRLRSDLRTFRPLIIEDWSKGLSDELRWLGSSLGEARDVDVLYEQLRMSSDDLEGDLDPLWDDLVERRSRGRETVLETLGSDRYKRLIDRLVEAAAEPGLEWQAITTSCEKVLPPLARRTWKSLAKRARALSLEDPDELWHAVRIRAKRARYAAEAVAPSLDPEVRKRALTFTKGAAGIQDILGRHQDAVVAQELISEMATKKATPGFTFALGRLFERQQKQAARLRASFFETWAEFDHKRQRSWLKT